MYPAGKRLCRWSGLLLASVGAGCASQPAIGRVAGGSHVSSAVVLSPPADLKMQSVGDLHITAAMTGHVPPTAAGALAPPAFPPGARTHRLGVVVIRVIVKVDPDGQVAAIGRDPAAFSTPTPYDREFDAAIAAAVQHWKLEPGYAVPLVPGPDAVAIMGTPAPETADLEATFTFNETGDVSVSSRP